MKSVSTIKVASSALVAAVATGVALAVALQYQVAQAAQTCPDRPSDPTNAGTDRGGYACMDRGISGSDYGVQGGSQAGAGLLWTDDLMQARTPDGAFQFDLIFGDSTFFNPYVTVANLDTPTGPLVSGSTHWDITGEGVIFLETDVGFLWQRNESAVPFEVTWEAYWDGVRQFPGDIAANGTVIGTELGDGGLSLAAFAWTEADGLEYLPMPTGATETSALFVSDNGQMIYGAAQDGLGGATKAVYWVNGLVYNLPAPSLAGPAWATLPHASNPSGTVAVGEASGTGGTIAVRWRQGGVQPLPPLLEAERTPIATRALFTSTTGARVIGTVEFAEVTSLVLWVGNWGIVADPPAGYTVVNVNAANPSCTAAVGSLAENGNRVPFLWTSAGGFELLGELGLGEEYDLSEARDVSDDGSVVVGSLRAQTVLNGFPPQTAFRWNQETGTESFNDILAPYIADPDFYDVVELSGNGEMVLLHGNLNDPVFNDEPPEVAAALLVEFLQ